MTRAIARSFAAAMLALAASLAAHAAAADSAQQVLRIGVNSFPASLGNPFKGNGRPGTLMWYALFDGLTQLDEQGRLVPGLALSWEQPDPLRWHFRLRPGVRYANGRPFDAEAAARVLGWLASPDGRRTVVGNELRAVKAARALEPLLLEVETSDVDPILDKRMVGALMVEPELWERLGPDGFAQQPVGTGPYLLERWDQRRRRAHATLNPHRWRPTHFGRLEWVELPDAAVRTQALLSLDVDIAPVEIEEMDRLVARGYPVITRPSMSVMSIAFVTERDSPGPLQDVRVRRALNYAVDKEALARVLLRGYGLPAGQPGPAIAFGHDPDLEPYPYDPARARKMLAEAGYPDGFRISAEVQPNAFPADGLIYQAATHYLREVGVDVTLRTITFPQYLRNLQRNSFAGDAFGTAWNSAPYNDATRPMELFSCNRARPFFCDRELTRELDRVKRILPEQEREAEMRRLARAYQQAAPALFLVEQIDLYAYQPGLEGVVVRNRVPVYDLVRPRGGDARNP